MQQGLAEEGILIHLGRLIACGGGGAVKEEAGPVLIHLRSCLPHFSRPLLPEVQHVFRFLFLAPIKSRTKNQAQKN